VTIKNESVDVILFTADCDDRGGSGRPPNAKEKEIFNLWDKVGMGKKDFHGGTLIAFMKQLRDIIA
jgi:hypothetical protein